MVAPVIDDMLLPVCRLLVLLDEESETTGTIVRVSAMGGGRFDSTYIQAQTQPAQHARILFVKEMATEVTIDGVEYRAMTEGAVVGLIPN